MSGVWGPGSGATVSPHTYHTHQTSIIKQNFKIYYIILKMSQWSSWVFVESIRRHNQANAYQTVWVDSSENTLWNIACRTTWKTQEIWIFNNYRRLLNTFIINKELSKLLIILRSDFHSWFSVLILKVKRTMRVRAGKYCQGLKSKMTYS